MNKDKKTIALVMCVKNEEVGLEKAILSCKDFVNEIVICVDNSSQDKTLEIAKKYATTLKMYDWKDDFSDMRNFAHADVKSDWILFIDGHEYVDRHDRLTEFLNLDNDGLLVTVRMENCLEFRYPRIYKNGLKFSGQVHEKLNCINTTLYPRFVIQHNRIEGQSASASKIREMQRDDQIPRIMGENLKKDPTDIRSSFHLALWLGTKKRHKEALKYSKLYLKYSKLPHERWFVLFNGSLSHLALGNRFRAWWWANRASLAEPDRWENDKLKGLVMFDSGKYDKALPFLVKSFDQNSKSYAYAPMPRDDAGTWNLIGECFARCNVYDKAYVAFSEAVAQTDRADLKPFFQARADLMQAVMKGREN